MNIFLMVVGIIAVLGLVMYAFGARLTTASATDLTEEQEELIAIDLGSCDGISSVSETITIVDEAKPGTVVSGINAFFVKGKTGNNSLASALSLTPKAEYEALVGYADATYYSELAAIQTGCSNKETKIDLKKEGSPTVTFVNSDKITKNTASTQQALTGDDEKTVTMKMSVDPHLFFGADSCNKIIVEYDKTDIETVEIAGLSEAAVPDVHSFSNATYDGRKAFELYQLSGDVDEYSERVTVKTTSANPVSAGAHLIFTLLDCNGDINQDNNEVIFDVEDEDNNALSLQSTTATLYIS